MKIITVASAKGGVGKSTFCCIIAEMLASQGKQVLLADMDIGVRSLDILLGVSEKVVYNWGDVIKGNCESRKAITEIKKGIYLLPAPIDFCDQYSSENFAKMTDRLKKDFDYIFLDAPAGLESGFRIAAEASDECIIISTPDAVSVRAASYASFKVKGLGINDIRLVINKFNKKLHKNIDIDDFIDSVNARLLGIIPDSSEIYSSVNGKKIPYDCKGNQAFLRISKRILGENIPLRVNLL